MRFSQRRRPRHESCKGEKTYITSLHCCKEIPGHPMTDSQSEATLS